MLFGSVPAGEFTVFIEYDVNNNPIYVCKALPGTPTSATGWQIMRITFDVNNNPTNVEWADSEILFNKICDDRALYTYG